MNKHRFGQKTLLVFSFIAVLHLSFTSSISSPVLKFSNSHSLVRIKNVAAASVNLYDKLELQAMGLSQEAFDKGMKGLEYLSKKGTVLNDKIITIVDFTQASTEKRMYVIDLRDMKVLFNTYVAHGQKSGKQYAEQFSNQPESYQSSLGFYETLGTYDGKHGYSLKLAGLENGINDKAEERAIVMHSAPYVSETFIKTQGYCGRSWGCPALPEALSKPIIERIKNGSCLFIYSNNKNYLQNSFILNS